LAATCDDVDLARKTESSLKKHVNSSHPKIFPKLIKTLKLCRFWWAEFESSVPFFSLGKFALRLGGLPAFDIILLGWCGGRPKNKPPEDQVSIPHLILSLQGFEEIRREFFLF